MIIYSILRGTKGDGREVRSIVPSKHFSFFYHPFSFFLLPFFTSHGRRVAIETVWKPTKFLESRQQAASFRVSLSPSPPRQYTRYTVNNIGPDGGHWNVFSGPAFKRGGSGSPFRSRLWKHDHCKMSENAVSAVIVRSPRLCKDGIGGRIL